MDDRKLTLIHQIRVEKPCPMDWDAMIGDGQTRFCSGCQRHVHHLSAMSRAEAQSLLQASPERLCVRYQVGPNGEPLTADDLPKRPKWRLHALGAGVGLLLNLVTTSEGRAAVESLKCLIPPSTFASNNYSMGEAAAPPATERVTVSESGEVEIVDLPEESKDGPWSSIRL